MLLILWLPNTISNNPHLLTDRIGAGSSSLERESSFDDLNSEIETARVHSIALAENRQVIKDKIAKKEKKKDKRKKRHETNGTSSESDQNNCTPITQNMSEVQAETNGAGAIPSEMLPTERALEDEEKERQVEEERRKNREPPVVFTNIDVSRLVPDSTFIYVLISICNFQAKAELEALVRLVDGQLTKEEETSIEELHQYLIEGEGSWALGDNFLTFVGRILQDPNISTETRVHLLRALAFAALKDDVILLLHQDRRDHVLMNYAHDIDRRAPEEQQGWALFVRYLSNSQKYILFNNLMNVSCRCVIFLKIQALRNGYYIFPSGLSTISRLPIFAPPLRLRCIACWRHVQRSRTSARP